MAFGLHEYIVSTALIPYVILEESRALEILQYLFTTFLSGNAIFRVSYVDSLWYSGQELSFILINNLIYMMS